MQESRRKKEDLRHKIILFLRSCEELLITAARDLAVLTQHDIQARRIVSLSETREALQDLIQNQPANPHNKRKIGSLYRELLVGAGNICARVKLIKDNSLRRPVYERFQLNMDDWWRNLGTI